MSVPVEGSLVGRVVEDLKELTPPQMKHELRINHKVVVQPKTTRIVLSIIGEFLTESNQHPIQPSQYIGRIVDFRFKDCDSRHQYRRRFLIEVLRDGRIPRLSEIPRDGSDSESELTGGMLVVSDELNHSSCSGREDLTGGSDDFEVDRVGGLGREGTDFPGGGLTDSDFRFSDPG